MPSSIRFPAIAASAILLASVSISGCTQQPDDPEANVAEAPTTNLPAIPLPKPPLDRASLLSAVGEAASATAAGLQMPESVTSLDGRQFEIRIRFGCRGPTRELQDAWLGWSYDAEDRTIRVRAKPTISMDDPLVAKIAGEQFESVEGFWVPRPWLRQAVCPAAAAVTQQQPEPEPTPAAAETRSKAGSVKTEPVAAKAPAPQQQPEVEGEPIPRAPRVGLAQFFSQEDARTHRRDSRPYSALKTLPKDAPISSQGFNLVLSGRLRAIPGKGVIECVGLNSETPPECVVSAQFLRVRIEAPGTGEVIAEWTTG